VLVTVPAISNGAAVHESRQLPSWLIFDVRQKHMESLLSVWFSPRETVRKERHEPPWLTFVIVWTWGAAYALERSMFEGRFPHSSFEARLSFPIIVGLFGGLFYFWTMSVAIDLTGSWFKGRATSQQIRRALVVGAIPKAISVMFFVLMALILGHGFFDDTDLSEDSPLSDLIVILLLALLIIVLTIWSAIATSQALAEVQGFKSAWKAWLHYVVAFLSLAVVLAIPFVGWIFLRRAM
jgi:hypothetical protein